MIPDGQSPSTRAQLGTKLNIQTKSPELLAVARTFFVLYLIKIAFLFPPVGRTSDSMTVPT